MRVSFSDSAASKITRRDKGVDRKCSACKMKEDKEEPKKQLKINRKPSTNSVWELNDEITNDIDNVLSSEGSVLDSSTKEFMEVRFAYDFSNVRLHTDSIAAQSAHAIHAQAYTSGDDIIFAQGKYMPESDEGRRLIAHELVHTIQQNAYSAKIQRQANNQATQDNSMPAVPGTDIRLLLDEIESWLGSPVVRIALARYGFLGNLISLKVKPIFKKIRPILQLAMEVYQDPGRFIALMFESLGLRETAAEEQTRSIIAFIDPRYLECVWDHLRPMLVGLRTNWKEMLKGMAWDFLWPWDGVAGEFEAIWKRVRSLASNLRDLEFSRVYDDYLSILRHLNSALGRLYGWFFIAVTLIGGAIGGLAGSAAGGVGAIPGALAGAAAGAELAAAVGQALLVATIAIEGVSILKSAFNLELEDRTECEKECDCQQIASSSLTVGISLAFALLGSIASRFGKAIVQRFGKKVWHPDVARRPRGRLSTRRKRMMERQGQRPGRTPESRGDVLAGRFALAQQVREIFGLRKVTITDALSTADNFPYYDLTAGSLIEIRSQRTGQILNTIEAFDDAIARRENPLVTFDGGDIYQVRSHKPSQDLASTIIRDITDTNTAFTNALQPRTIGGVTSILRNPAQRILIVFLREPLQAADEALVRARVPPGMQLHLLTEGFPPGHPAVVAVEDLPVVISVLSQGLPREAVMPSVEEGLPATRCECEL
jgi:hypothetical protein